MLKESKDHINLITENEPGVSFDTRGFEDAFNEVPRSVARMFIPGTLVRDAWRNPEGRPITRYIPAFGGELVKAGIGGLAIYAAYISYQAIS